MLNSAEGLEELFGRVSHEIDVAGCRELLAAGVVHNPSGTSVLCAGSALLLRAVTFGLFLHQAGRPSLRAWTLLLEPAVGLFRSWSWWKGATTDSTAWK